MRGASGCSAAWNKLMLILPKCIPARRLTLDAAIGYAIDTYTSPDRRALRSAARRGYLGFIIRDEGPDLDNILCTIKLNQQRHVVIRPPSPACPPGCARHRGPRGARHTLWVRCPPGSPRSRPA